MFASLATAAATTPVVRVLHAEAVEISFDRAAFADSNSNRKLPDHKTGHITHTARFNALGRDFVLALEPNTELNEVAGRADATAFALRGTIAEQPSSWVRLTVTGKTMHGLMWDGQQLIAIAPAAQVQVANAAVANSANAGAANASAANKETLIFRLADTAIATDSNSCATVQSADTGAALYQNLNRELESSAETVAKSGGKAGQTGATYRLQLSALMDAAYLQRYASNADATDALIARINNVDGIFTAELGVHVELTYAGPADISGTSILTHSLVANDVLQSLGLLRASSATLYGTGVTHLFTGRELDGKAVGLAYVGAVCSQRYGVGLSQIYGSSTWYESLIVAHELGHNFGAEHDGEGACASVPNSYLMAATIGDSNRFSQCSLERMQRQIAQSNCLLPMPRPDFAVAANFGERRATTQETFEWTMTATNLGEAAVVNGNVQIMVPAELTVHSTSVDAGNCSAGAGVVECAMGQVNAHALRTIRLNLSAVLPGTYRISAALTANADANTANNSGQGNIVIEAPQPPAAGATPNASPPANPEQSGGGPIGAVWLLVLAAVLVMRSRVRLTHFGSC